MQIIDKEEECEEFLSYKIYLLGYATCAYHADVVQNFRSQIGEALPMECIGGGRIKKDNTCQKISVYGYSQEFGQADHSLSVELLKKKFTNFTIDFSNEGY